MKKYSAEDSEKKLRILYKKLLIKNGFIDEVKKKRKELGIPIENGFTDSSELALYLIKKLTATERETAIFIAHMRKYEHEEKKEATEEDSNKHISRFLKERKNKDAIILAIFYINSVIDDHTNLFTSDVFFKMFEKNKYFSNLSPIVFKLLNKYWGFDLLDEQTAVHFVEKYLFLGESGVNNYIKNRLACPNCKYIGIQHFSPDRNNMEGKDEGAFSKNYIFNDRTNRRLSSHFNSVFLIIKPYATKEQVIQYVEENWHWLKDHVVEKNLFYKQDGIHPSKIKESDFDKNQLVYYLYKLSKKELAEQYREIEKDLPIPTYKESIASLILEKKYGIQMTSDAVKKAATRFAKSAKIQREPKDIRDI